MLCQSCHERAASVHFTQIINGKKSEMYLCEQCAKEKGQINIASPDLASALSVNDFFCGLMGICQPEQYTHTFSNQEATCEKCGMSYQEFQRMGKLGCDNCYSVFSDKLRPLLKRLHGNAMHNGKIPAGKNGSINASREIERLKALLNKLVQNEQYEKAAEIRDKIKNLETADFKETP